MAAVSFLGGAQEVTGSCYLLETERGGRILLECGMHQGGDAVERIEREHFKFDPADIDVVIISHAHLDHSGLLPKLFQEGFSGQILSTRATLALLEIMLRDSVGLYLRDLERTNRRNSQRRQDSRVQLREILSETWKEGGSVMIPAFAVGRTQDILFHLGSLFDQGELDSWEIFLDSPMAIAVTQVYDFWLDANDGQGVRHLTAEQKAYFNGFLSLLNMAMKTEDSMAINRIKGGAIIIAGSGMCTGGRIRHHLKQRIGDNRNVVIFTGYQARGTLGRQLVDGRKDVKIFGENFAVRARIETLGGLSAHAGQTGLVEWIAALDSQRTLLVHGENRARIALADRLRRDHGITVEIPARGTQVTF